MANRTIDRGRRVRRGRVPTWLLVGFGLLLNIISALLTNFYIDDATRQANGLIQQQQTHEKLITLIWTQIETVERKRELVLALVTASELAGQPLPSEVQQQLTHTLTYWLSDLPAELTTAHVPELMAALNEYQDSQRERIDQLYLDNLELTAEYGEQMASISRMRNLALFLQMLGLAFVLARDLSRRSER
ncbi:hypothetical protein C9I92_07945 [Photobacterium ganghwense]|uniref:DNA mismatch repair protein n=1 Tax=Photobacterium ganghwense TaxID=320778 RepID=A0A0J1JQP8_9GAMM|nr:hypothetical protein [Photobacterium ganghwense]KLV04577.1 hypothetical protein ABT57_23755 [Photobacterium ganghwense]PSU09462.1 hypothetical protein C9I92_07945 [Photobacterium ganghwense]QSV16704.1 hypothetical protein FH974_17165 [Photobacterium ganghwense]